MAIALARVLSTALLFAVAAPPAAARVFEFGPAGSGEATHSVVIYGATDIDDD